MHYSLALDIIKWYNNLLCRRAFIALHNLHAYPAYRYQFALHSIHSNNYKTIANKDLSPRHIILHCVDNHSLGDASDCHLLVYKHAFIALVSLSGPFIHQYIPHRVVSSDYALFCITPQITISIEAEFLSIPVIADTDPCHYNQP